MATFISAEHEWQNQVKQPVNWMVCWNQGEGASIASIRPQLNGLPSSQGRLLSKRWREKALPQLRVENVPPPGPSATGRVSSTLVPSSPWNCPHGQQGRLQ